MRRPLGITIVASLIIVLAALGLLGVIFVSVHRPAMPPHVQAFLARDPVPLRTQHAVGFLAGVVEIIAAILILNRWEMGRTIYALIGAITLIFAFATSPLKAVLAINLLVFAIFLFFLFHPTATRWFRRTDVWRRRPVSANP